MISIEHSRDGRIATLILNRPERRNALDQSLVLELTRVLTSLDQDEFVRVVLLTGAGKAFSAGADLDALATMGPASDEENLADSEALASLFEAIRTCSKVIIAWVNGHAIAGGSGLATACDLSFASSSAKFGFTGSSDWICPCHCIRFTAFAPFRDGSPRCVVDRSLVDS